MWRWCIFALTLLFAEEYLSCSLCHCLSCSLFNLKYSIVLFQNCAIWPQYLVVWEHVALLSQDQIASFIGELQWQSQVAHLEIIIRSGPCYFTGGCCCARRHDAVCCCAFKKLALVRGPNDSTCTISKLIERERNLFYLSFLSCFSSIECPSLTFYIMKCCWLSKQSAQNIFVNL